ncbi:MULTISPECIES: YHYH domain-containing protein [Acinetobacter]|nr:YHYH domain-containing protein [Acinetobacter lwoffii]
MKFFLLICFIGMSFTYANAHSGGTNSQGCHTNSKTGDYHCH